MSYNNGTFVDGVYETIDRLQMPALAGFTVGAIGALGLMARNAAEAIMSGGWNDKLSVIQSHVEGAAPVISHLAQTAFHLVSR